MIEEGAVLGGKYRVLAKLGEGGMGAVFRAENQLTGKQVAIKCLQPELNANPEASERLLREARTASSLSHPNIVDVYDVVRDDDALVIVMELLQGETLGSYLLRQPMPQLNELVSLMLPAMAGVLAAHERGVIHRDLKPENIFLERVAGVHQPVAKVLDFGVAKLLTTRGKTLTQTGTTLGTPHYMSLEQLRGDKDLDERTDVYAFGVMLYEAATGRLPYEAETVPELAIKVATTEAPRVRVLRPDVPASLATLIDRAIARERAQRLPDVRSLMEGLQTFLSDPQRAPNTQPSALPATSLPKSEARAADTFDAHELPNPRAPRQKIFSGWAALGAVLTASLFGIAFGFREPESQPPTSAVSGALGEREQQGPHPLLAPASDTAPESAEELPTQAQPTQHIAPSADAGVAAAPAPPSAAATQPTPVTPTPARPTPQAVKRGTDPAPAPPAQPPRKKSSLERIGL